MHMDVIVSMCASFYMFNRLATYQAYFMVVMMRL
jgi:hypothetical protein